MMNPKIKKFLRFFLTRLPFVLLLGVGLMAGSLKLVEKYPVPMKEGFEKFLSEKTRTNATIGNLDKIKFIPDFEVTMRNLTMHNPENAGVIDLEINEFNLKSPAWSVFLNGKRISHLDISGFKAKENIVSPHALDIKSMKIEDRQGPEQYGSFLVATGKYAKHNMKFEASLEKVKNNYIISNEIPFSLELDDYEVTGTYNKKFSGIWMERTLFSKKKKSSVPQDYLLMKSGEYNKDNPLICMIDNKDLSVCNKYLEEKE